MRYRSFLVVTMLLLFKASLSAAVECPVTASVANELKRATAVFSGEVVAEEYREVKFGEDAGAKVLVVKLKVHRWWKGVETNEVFLYTSVTKFPNNTTRENAEDFRFRKGERYLVYAFSFKGRMGTSGCTRTKMLSEAEEDLRELGQGSEPTKQ